MIQEAPPRPHRAGTTLLPPIAELRRRILRDLPRGASRPDPRRVLGFLPHAALAAGGTWALLAGDPPWPLALLASLAIGHSYAALAFLAHEAMHGAMVRSRRVQTLLGYIGFGPLLVSPHLWRAWHNHAHHAFANRGDADPDSFGGLERFRRLRSARFVTRLAPGSGRWPSLFFLFYWFTFHAQVVLWIQSRALLSFRRFERRRAVLDTAAALALWLALAAVAGPRGAVFVVLLPLAFANFFIMSYVATNHFLRPQTASDQPLESSMSVDTLPLVDRVHAHFSHHVEHHLFPAMSGRHLPLVRRWLREHAAERYVSPPHWKAIAWLYRTPRVYRDERTLCDPDRPGRAVALADVTRRLKA